MDEFLARLGVQAVNYAMRCGIALTSTFALQQCSRLLKTVDNKVQHAELQVLQKTLNSKIKIISPALDLIEFKSGRGNVFLGHAAVLAKALHRDIVALGKRLEKAAVAEELSQTQNGYRSYTTEESLAGVGDIICEIKSLLARIDGDIPLLQLAITASGESLSTALPPSISPSRLLQASMFLVVGDTQFSSDPCRPVQIGPSFTLSLYMLFLGHSSTTNGPSQASAAAKHDQELQNNTAEQPYGIGDGERKPIWQEVLHKVRVRICRIPQGWQFQPHQGYIRGPCQSIHESSASCAVSRHDITELGQQEDYTYHLEMVEDLDDGRAHEEEEESAVPLSYDSVRHAGLHESVPIHQVSKIFYTDTGRILNIGTANDLESTSVLLLKRDMAAAAPSGTMAHMVPDLGDNDGEPADEQDDIDRQLREESEGLHSFVQGSDRGGQIDSCWQFPRHLDPEWLALEVFAGDGDEQDDGGGDSEGESVESEETPIRPGRGQRTSVDAHLAEQMRTISVAGTAPRRQTVSSDDSPAPGRPEPPVSQPPFGAVTSSLSLLEMLVRLTSLQEFQQTSHLSIPDHILTFFLEETSTTGLRGEAQWQAKRAAERKMGFDPFTDTPAR